MSDRSDTAFFGHPRGLSTLFFTEMWERFSYYGMRAFLVLFMTADTKAGGLGFSPAKAGIIYGMYTASVYLMSVPGGWIADRFLGLRRAVLIGGVGIMFGHIALAMPIAQGFYAGLILIVLGTGLLKPCISTIVGQLYTKEDPRRDAGYSIYYMGINIGAFFAPLLCGYLAQDERFRYFLKHSLSVDPNSAWHFGFAAAAVGMAAGLIQYYLGMRHLGDVGAKPVAPANPAEASRNKTILAAILAGVVALPVTIVVLLKAGVLGGEEDVRNLFGLVLIAVSVAVFAMLYRGAENRDETRRVTVILVLFVGAVMFFGCFEQAGSVLNLFAENHSRRDLAGFSFPASWLQSVNSVFIIVLAPVFAALWVWWNKRGSEPSAPAKFGAGLVLVGAGFLVMIPAAMAIDGDPIKLSGYFGALPAPTLVSPSWLIGLYFMHTCAELCLSPVGLSSMSKLAPQRWGGFVMGIWFLGAAIGNFLAGQVVEYSDRMAPTDFFLMMIAFPVILAAVFFVLVKPIGRMLARS
jgi:POT family proton-dependent oligopeptide transporter